ncbi:MAG: hypothetical protein RLZZ15_3160 [Verrucomicrobiota bacterium]|jgi:hypothetical protein
MHLARRSLPALTSLFFASSLLAAEPAKPAAATTPAATIAGLAELLKATGLTQPQVLNGVKSGLGTAVDLAATELAKPGAFQLTGPASMAKLQTLLVKANQSGALDGFKASLNQAATSVAPQAALVLKDSLKTLTLDDAAALAAGAPGSATKLLRKTAEPALRTKLIPLVNQAIASNATAAHAKDLAAKAGPMAAMLGVPSATDLENYLLGQVIETSFGYVAQQEAALRANPAALKDKSAAKIFSLGKK